jgi:hypothetical protein
MSSRRVRLRTITGQDSAFLYELMLSREAGGRVRFGGGTPSPEAIASSLWESVLAQFVIEGVASRKPLGLVAITSANFRDSYTYLSALGPAALQGSGLIAEGVLLGFDYAFATWPFRKIYMEATDESYQAFGSGLGRFFVEEGRLREHAYWNGRFTDVRILAVYRQVWLRLGPAMRARLSGAAAPANTPALAAVPAHVGRDAPARP